MNNEDYRSALAHCSAALVHLKALGVEADEFKKRMLFAMAGGELASSLKYLSSAMEGEAKADAVRMAPSTIGQLGADGSIYD